MRYTKQECIESLQAAADEVGEPLTVQEYREMDFSPSHRTMKVKFGSWREALQAAGLEALEHGIHKHRTPPKMYTTKAGYECFCVHEDEVKSTLAHHRLLAVAEFGLEAVADKVVHHGASPEESTTPWDNRPDNLEVMDNSEHVRMHAKQRDHQRKFQRDDRGRFV